MATTKITDLTAYTNPVSTDVLPIVDVSGDLTKKVSIADLMENAGSGSAAAPGISFDGDSNTGIYRPGADQVAISTGGTGRLFVDASGNVGIGTTSVSNTLHIAKEANHGITLERTVSNPGSVTLNVNSFGAAALTAANAVEITAGAGAFTAFKIGSTEAARIDSSGRLGLGISSPDRLLHLSSNVYPQLRMVYPSVQTWDTGVESTGFYSITRAGQSAAITVDTSNRVGIGTTSPGALLELGTATPILRFSDTDTTGYHQIQSSNANFIINADPSNATASSSISFNVDGSEKARIDSSGRLGLGTSSPGYPLTVNGRISYSGAIGEGADTTLSSSSTTVILADSATWQNLQLKTNGQNRLYINSSGNVGIGTTSPSEKLAVHGKLYLNNGSASYFDAASSNGLIITNPTAVRWEVNSSERARIDSSGRLGLGTSSPSNTLHVVGTGRFNVSGLNNALIASDGGDPFLYTEQAAGLKLGTNSAVRMTINSSGSVGIGTTSPSARLEVSTAAATEARITSTVDNNADLTFYTNSVQRGIVEGNSLGMLLGTTGALPTTFITNNTERARIDSSGRLGLGTSSVDTKFDVAGSSQTYTGAPAITFTDTGSGQATANRWIAGNIAVVNYGDFALAVAPDTTSTSFSPKITVTEAGNVGIGTASPASILHCASTGDNNIRVVANGATAQFGVDVGVPFVGTNSGPFNLYSNGQIHATLDSSGRLLVGTSTARSNYFNAGVISSLLNLEVSTDAQIEFAGIRNRNNADGAVIALAKSRGTTAGSNTIVSSGDEVGRVSFQASDGSEFVEAASIQAVVDGTPGANDMPGRLVFSTTADGASSPTERMRIANDGAFYVQDVYDTTTVNAANVEVNSNGRLRRSTSSAKYKTNVQTLEDSYADAILNCRPVWYQSLCNGDNPDHGHWGFIAEEVAEIDPRLVFWKTVDISHDENGSQVETPCDPEPEGVAYDRFVPHLLNLIKRQQQAIETLEAKVAALEAG